MLGGVPHNKAKWFFELKGKRSGAKGTEYDFSKLLAEDFDDEFKGEKSSITTIRIGRIFKLHKERVTVIGLYLGIGIADKTKYLQYYDKYEILDDEGNYYLDNGGKLLISPALGFMIFGKEVMSKFGIDINPTGVAIGIGYMF